MLRGGAVLSFLKKEDVSLALLQETHLEDKDHVGLQRNWAGQASATSYSSFSRGVDILISKSIVFKSLNRVKDSHGHYVIVKGILSGKKITFMNLYCPPGYSHDFLSKAFAEFTKLVSGDSWEEILIATPIPLLINWKFSPLKAS